MRSNAICAGAVATLFMALVPGAAWATFPGPPGYAMQPTVSAPAGGNCNGCHGNATRPTATLTGPDTVAAGASASFTLTGTGPATLRCLIATEQTARLTPMSGSIENSPFGNYEIIPTNAGGSPCNFQFSAAAGGTYTIYYAIASAPGSPGGGAEGIGYQSGRKTITVSGGTNPGTDAGVRDSGTNPGFDSGTPPVKTDGGGVVTPLADGGSIVTFPDGATAPGPPSNGNGNGGGLTPSDDEGGCNTTGGSLSLSGIFAAGAVATFLLGSRRLARRRRQT